MTPASDITSAWVCTSAGIMAGPIPIQIFTLVSVYVNTWKARWRLWITTINVTSLLSALPSASLVLCCKSSYTHIIWVSTWRSSRGYNKAKLFFSKSVVLQISALRLKAQAPTRRGPLQPPNTSMPVVGTKRPTSPQEAGRMSLALCIFPTG